MEKYGKQQLFDKYSKNLELVMSLLHPEKSDEVKGKYVCPICIRLFTIDDLEMTKENHLTREHIPPQSVGWQRQVLTCYECNCGQGSKIDAHLGQTLHLKSFNMKTPGIIMNANISLDSMKVAGKANVNHDGTVNYEVSEKSSNPKHTQAIRHALTTSQKNLTMKWKTGDLKMARISMIRAAYLWGFAEYGYAFTYNPNFSHIRTQLLEPDKDLFFDRYVLNGDFPAENQGLNLLTHPEGCECYGFIMHLTAHKIIDKVCVLLPGADQDGLNRLNRLKGLINKQQADLEYVQPPKLDLMNQERCLDPLMFWLENFSQEED